MPSNRTVIDEQTGKECTAENANKGVKITSVVLLDEKIKDEKTK